MTAPNPFHIADTAQRLARDAPKNDAVVFNKVAMICMGTMAAASVMQMLLPLLRELNSRHAGRSGDGRGRGR